MIAARSVPPPPPAILRHVAALLSWPGPVADDPPPSEAFEGTRHRAIPVGVGGGWIVPNLAHPELQPDGHNR